MTLIRNEVGSYLYVWSQQKGKPSRSKVVITAHGGKSLINGMQYAPACTLYYYADHGYALNDPKVEQVITGAIHVRQIIASQQSQDYFLTKYTNSTAQPKHNAFDETYASIGGMDVRIHSQHQNLADGVDAFAALQTKSDSEAGTARMTEELEKRYRDMAMDIVTIRARKTASPQRLSQVLNALWHSGYKYTEVHCSFCRGGPQSQSAFPIDFRQPLVPSYE